MQSVENSRRASISNTLRLNQPIYHRVRNRASDDNHGRGYNEGGQASSQPSSQKLAEKPRLSHVKAKDITIDINAAITVANSKDRYFAGSFIMNAPIQKLGSR